MKKNNIIYWATTGIFAFFATFGGYMTLMNNVVKGSPDDLGFPDYFMTELGIAKILGALCLVIPQAPRWLKEWAYFGLGIVMVSAAWAHFSHGDEAAKIIMPLVFLGMLVVSYQYQDKREA